MLSDIVDTLDNLYCCDQFVVPFTCWPPLWVAKCVSGIQRSWIRNCAPHHKAITHYWDIPCRQCTEICSHVSSIQNNPDDDNITDFEFVFVDKTPLCGNDRWCIAHVSNSANWWHQRERICHHKDNIIENISFLFLNSSFPGQNGRRFADGIFRCIFVNEKFVFWLKIHWSFFLSVQLTISQHWFK